MKKPGEQAQVEDAAAGRAGEPAAREMGGKEAEKTRRAPGGDPQISTPPAQPPPSSPPATPREQAEAGEGARSGVKDAGNRGAGGGEGKKKKKKANKAQEKGP